MDKLLELEEKLIKAREELNKAKHEDEKEDKKMIEEKLDEHNEDKHDEPKDEDSAKKSDNLPDQYNNKNTKNYIYTPEGRISDAKGMRIGTKHGWDSPEHKEWRAGHLKAERKWQNSNKKPEEVIKFDSKGQWSMNKAYDTRAVKDTRDRALDSAEASVDDKFGSINLTDIPKDKFKDSKKKSKKLEKTKPKYSFSDSHHDKPEGNYEGGHHYHVHDVDGNIVGEGHVEAGGSMSVGLRHSKLSSSGPARQALENRLANHHVSQGRKYGSQKLKKGDVLPFKPKKKDSGSLMPQEDLDRAKAAIKNHKKKKGLDERLWERSDDHKPWPSDHPEKYEHEPKKKKDFPRPRGVDDLTEKSEEVIKFDSKGQWSMNKTAKGKAYAEAKMYRQDADEVSQIDDYTDKEKRKFELQATDAEVKSKAEGIKADKTQKIANQKITARKLANKPKI